MLNLLDVKAVHTGRERIVKGFSVRRQTEIRNRFSKLFILFQSECWGGRRRRSASLSLGVFSSQSFRMGCDVRFSFSGDFKIALLVEFYELRLALFLFQRGGGFTSHAFQNLKIQLDFERNSTQLA